MRRACLTVRGAEATHFLQNLVTCEVEGLAVGDLTFGALLTPQGKVLFDFFMLREEDGYLLDTLADARDALVQRLAFYKLRAQVEVAADTRQVVLGDTGSADPRSDGLPPRAYGDAERVESGYDAARIAAGVPEAGREFAYGEAFPHDVAMDRYARSGAGIAMRKGCYVGQEVVSRMEHRGTARRRPVVLKGGSFAVGAEVEADGRSAGVIGTADGDTALAIVRLDRLEAAAKVTVGGERAEWSPSPLLAR